PASVCVDSGIILGSLSPGGTWSCSNTHATIVAGTVTGVTAGSDIISYTVSNACATRTTTKVITINPLPDAGTITGSGSICPGSSISLTDTTTGGTWSSANTAIANVSGAGVVTGVTTGVSTILYMVTN